MDHKQTRETPAKRSPTLGQPDQELRDLTITPERERLPDTRESVTHKFSVSGHEGYITVGLYPDGRPGELFITMAKKGSTVRGIMDCFGIAISLCLQYGVPLESLVDKFSHTRFEPMGHTPNPEIGTATSVVDYIVRWLDVHFADDRDGTTDTTLADERIVPPNENR